MMTIYTPAAIANSFLERAKKSNKPLTPMQLQKLMYFAQGWWLTYSDDPLIDEPFEAWEHGPVCASVYHEFKHFGSRSIDKSMIMLEVEYSDITEKFEVRVAKPVEQSDRLATSLLDFVWEKYSDFSGVELSSMTHANREKNPWKTTIEAARKQKIKRGASIANDDIKAYFNELLKNKEFY